MKPYTKDVLFVLLLVGVIIFMGFVMYYMVAHKTSFFDHPLRYYADKRGYDCNCICNEGINLQFNDTSVTIKDTRYNIKLE